MPGHMLGSCSGTLIGAFVFTLFIKWLHAYTSGRGNTDRFLGMARFHICRRSGAALFSGKDKDLVWPLILIQAGHSLAGMLVTGAILGTWR